MPTSRALVLVQQLAAISEIERVSPDVRAGGDLAAGEPFVVDASGSADPCEIEALLNGPWVESVDIVEGCEDCSGEAGNDEVLDASLWRVTVYFSDTELMPAVRGLLVVQKLLSLGQVESVSPDVRKEEKLEAGVPLTVELSGCESAQKIEGEISKDPRIERVVVERASTPLAGTFGSENSSGEVQRPSERMTNAIEEISEEIVFAEVFDPDSFSKVRALLEEIASEGVQGADEDLVISCRSGANLLDKLAKGESGAPEEDWEYLQRVVSSLQAFSRRDPDMEFPPCPGSRSSNYESPRTSPEREDGITSPSFSLPATLDDKLLTDFLSRHTSGLADLEEKVLRLENSGGAEPVRDLLRWFHGLKGDSQILGIEAVERLCHAVEGALQQDGEKVRVDGLLAVKDWLGSAFSAYSHGNPAPEFPKTVLDRIGTSLSPGFKSEPREGAISSTTGGEDTGWQTSVDVAPEMIEAFVSESTEHLDNADVHLLTIETNPHDEEALNAVFRGFHTIKGSSGMLGLTEMNHLAHEAENLLGMARDGKLTMAGEAIDSVFDTVDALRRMIAASGESLAAGTPPPREEIVPQLLSRIQAVASGRPLSPEPLVLDCSDKRIGEALVDSCLTTKASLDDALRVQSQLPRPKKLGEVLRESNLSSERRVELALREQAKQSPPGKLGEIMVARGDISEQDLRGALDKQSQTPAPPKIGELLVRSGSADPKSVAHALRSQERGATRQRLQVREAVKVEAGRLDRLIDTIGELVIAESMVSQSSELRGVASQQLVGHLSHLQKITRELQEMGTSLRMVPIRPTFQKMARLVRDLARKSNKRVEFAMSGEDTELDKTVVDSIGDPLVHMIRNSMDHGIEPRPEDRIRAGKPEVGHVHLRAYHKGGNIYIEIQDDGRGLDREAILAKAIERGLVREGEPLSDREVFNLIFQPGFSTAKVVTDVSGRGVGMDVVKRNIEALRGQVEIMSEPGMGSIFTIRLPLTLAIIDGMVVRVGGDRYIIPTLSIIQSIRPLPEDLSSVLNKGQMLAVQDRLIPLFNLSRIFEVDNAVQDPLLGTVVVVEDEDKQTGILVDELMGQQQIVIKPLGELLHGAPGLSGGAIMPDGQVGLILDVAGIVRLAVCGNGCGSPTETAGASLVNALETENKTDACL